MNRKVLLVGLLIVAPLLIFLALSFGKDPRALDSPLVGKVAPNFALRTLDGEMVQLDDLMPEPWVALDVFAGPINDAGQIAVAARIPGVNGIRALLLTPIDSCPADIDGDGAVNVTDLLAVLAAWGECPGCPEDLDGDGNVGIADLLELLASWGPCP